MPPTFRLSLSVILVILTWPATISFLLAIYALLSIHNSDFLVTSYFVID